MGYSFHAPCDQGVIEAAISTGRLIGHRNIRSETVTDEQEIFLAPGARKYTEHEFAYFLDCIESGATSLTKAAESLQRLQVIWRLYEAEDNNTITDLRGLGLDR